MAKEPERKLLLTGLFGSVVAALCCFTPILVVLLGAVGLSGVLGWIDYALFPLLFFSLAVVAQALWLRAGRRGPDPKIWAVLLASLFSVLIIALEFRFALRITLAAAAATGGYALILNRLPAKRATP